MLHSRPQKVQNSSTFASYKMPEVQDRIFVLKKTKNGPMTLIRHMMGRHMTNDLPCGCGFTNQEVLDKMRWNDIPTFNSFKYSSPWREYPRLIREMPKLDHMRYLRQVALYRPAIDVLGIFITSQCMVPFEDLEPELNLRCKGSYVESIYADWKKMDKSHQSATINRWMSCPSTKNFAEVFKKSEAILEVMTS